MRFSILKFFYMYIQVIIDKSIVCYIRLPSFVLHISGTAKNHNKADQSSDDNGENDNKQSGKPPRRISLILVLCEITFTFFYTIAAGLIILVELFVAAFQTASQQIIIAVGRITG